MPNHPLKRLAEKVRCDSFFLGASLLSLQRARKWTDEDLASFLECDIVALDRLACCRAPRGNDPTFADEVRSISGVTGCCAERLASALREVEAVAALLGAGGASATNALLAARDRKNRAQRTHTHGRKPPKT
jgi:hypothetical protein